MNVRRSAIAFVAIALLASSALALDIPPKPTQWVNDYGAHALSDSQIQQLNEKLEAFDKKTGVQFLIMVFPSLEGEDDLGYTNKVANVWKVKDDKALMLFVFIKEHKARIQVGYSMEPVVTDAFSSDVISTMRPFFRESDYAGGLNAAVDQIATKVDPTFVSTGGTPAAPRRAPGSRSSFGNARFVIWLFVFIFFVLLPMLSRGRNRRGGCGGCWWPMLFLGGGGGSTFGGGGSSGGGWGTGGSWGGGGSSFGGGGAGGGW